MQQAGVHLSSQLPQLAASSACKESSPLFIRASPRFSVHVHVCAELDDVMKLDTTNSHQMQLMYTHFSHNMG